VADPLMPRLGSRARKLPPCGGAAQAIRASLLANATTISLRWKPRSIMPFSQHPSGVSLCDNDGSASLAPWTSRVRKQVLPRLEIPISCGLPPVVCCRGTSPSYAPRSLALAKLLASPTAAIRAVALSTSTPGMDLSRRAAASLRTNPMNPLSRASILASVRAIRHAVRPRAGAGVVTMSYPGRPAWHRCRVPACDVPPEKSSRAPAGSTAVVDQAPALGHQARSDAVKRLSVQLLLSSQFDEAHRRTLGSLGDSLSVTIIVLLRFDMRAHVLRRHQPDLVPVCGKPTPRCWAPQHA